MNMPEKSVLDKEVHARLIQDMDHVCATANIPPLYVHRRMAEFCPDADIKFVKDYRRLRAEGQGGYMITGKASEPRCMAMVGAFLRNFIDARLVTINQLIEGAKEGIVSDPTVLVCPNLFVSTFGKALTSWQIQSVFDILLARMTQGKLTVVYVEDLKDLADKYGLMVHDHLATHFLTEEHYEAVKV